MEGSGGEEIDGEEGGEERERDKGVAIGTLEKERFQNWTINTEITEWERVMGKAHVAKDEAIQYNQI